MLQFSNTTQKLNMSHGFRECKILRPRGRLFSNISELEDYVRKPRCRCISYMMPWPFFLYYIRTDSFPVVAVAKHQTGDLNHRHLMSPVLEVGSLRTRCGQGWFPLRPLSSACGWLCPPWVLTGSPCVCVCALTSL